ncbi:MAG: bifunctional folylpolyglutamate synthase/dihydrofolate synthase [Thermoguttaceae bacterium]
MENRYKEAIAFLDGRVNYETFQSIPYYEMERRLGRLRLLLDSLGSPDSSYPVIHVAGTKGKGSVCIMLESVLHHCGYKTGRFSSPHLQSFLERFSINGKWCPENPFADLMLEIRDSIVDWEKEEGPLTYFELTTLFAMMYFARENVDCAVFEVGMGGRLDSTNVCCPIVTVITSISYDHTEQLGPTLADIAFEKAGIIKPGVPVISGVRQSRLTQKNVPEPDQVIRRIANQKGASLIDGERIWEDYYPLSPPLAVLGDHQHYNAALVLAVLDVIRNMGWSLPHSTCRTALSQVTLPGRVEVLNQHPVLIVDGAHNRASIIALLQSVRDAFPTVGPTNRSLLFGSMSGKDVVGMLSELLPHFNNIVLTELPDIPRCIPAQKLYSLLVETLHFPSDTEVGLTIQPDWQQGITDLLEKAESNDVICVTGSFYLIAKVRNWFLKECPQNTDDINR